MKKELTIGISGVIHCRSGLRIGGSDELLRSGAEDLAVIKHPVSLRPYIPGSSLKGRMRCEMEARLGLLTEVRGGNGQIIGYDPHGRGCTRPQCPICVVFGPYMSANHPHLPSRLICRDAQPLSGDEITYEYKTETVIDRGTASAKHPRRLERVSAGSRFGLKLVIQVWDRDREFNYDGASGVDGLFRFVLQSLRLVQICGLGGGVNRGSGEVEFIDLRREDTGSSLTL